MLVSVGMFACDYRYVCAHPLILCTDVTNTVSKKVAILVSFLIHVVTFPSMHTYITVCSMVFIVGEFTPSLYAGFTP